MRVVLEEALITGDSWLRPARDWCARLSANKPYEKKGALPCLNSNSLGLLSAAGHLMVCQDLRYAV
jgi:hypothetical protein